jgi:hypothetical protein
MIIIFLSFLYWATSILQKTFLSSSPGSQAATAESQAESQNLGLFVSLKSRLLEWSRQFEIMDSVAWNAFFNWVILYVVCLSMIFSHYHLQATILS